MITYTKEYLHNNNYVIECPNLVSFKKVTKFFKCASILRDYMYNNYKDKTVICFLQKYNTNEFECCYDMIQNSSSRQDKIITYRQFLKDNNLTNLFKI